MIQSKKKSLSDGPTDRWTDRLTDGRTKRVVESHERDLNLCINVKDKLVEYVIISRQTAEQNLFFKIKS